MEIKGLIELIWGQLTRSAAFGDFFPIDGYRKSLEVGLPRFNHHGHLAIKEVIISAGTFSLNCVLHFAHNVT